MRPLLLLLPLLLLAPHAAGQEEEYMLHMLGFKYIPDPLEVPPGANIIAMNFDEEPHTVTSATDRSLFDVTNIKPGGEPYPFRAPMEPGTYPYYCIYHGDREGNGMAGILVVTQPAASTPPTDATPTATPSRSPDARNDSPAPWAAALVALALVALLFRRR